MHSAVVKTSIPRRFGTATHRAVHEGSWGACRGHAQGAAWYRWGRLSGAPPRTRQRTASRRQSSNETATARRDTLRPTVARQRTTAGAMWKTWPSARCVALGPTSLPTSTAAHDGSSRENGNGRCYRLRRAAADGRWRENDCTIARAAAAGGLCAARGALQRGYHGHGGGRGAQHR